MAVFVAACGFFALGSGALGQINPFGRLSEGLPREDLQLMAAASDGLYKNSTAQKGALAAWKGEASGNFGTVELVDIFQWNGMPCRKLQHIVSFKNEKDPRHVIVERCLTVEGEWKLKF